jgi:hypothetical protein
VGGRDDGRRRGRGDEEGDGEGSGELGHFLFLVMLADGCAREWRWTDHASPLVLAQGP